MLCNSTDSNTHTLKHNYTGYKLCNSVLGCWVGRVPGLTRAHIAADQSTVQSTTHAVPFTMPSLRYLAEGYRRAADSEIFITFINFYLFNFLR